MRVLHVVKDLDVASGGPSQSVPSLSNALIKENVESKILFEDLGNPITDVISDVDRHSCFGVRRRNRFWTVNSLERILHEKHNGIQWDVIHLHGLWNGLNHAASRLAKRNAIAVVVTPRGMAEAWALRQKPLRKKIALRLFQKCDLERATILHATGDGEARQLRHLGLTPRIAVIPNGTQFPSDSLQRKTPETNCRRVLFLSRIHPKKGLPNLIQAWNSIRPKGWECVIAGPDQDGHLAELKSSVKSNGLESNILFHPPVFGDEKWALISSADLFVLPSHSENFGIVIAEALACGVPVITTRETPWKELETHACGWWINDDPATLTETLKKAIALDNTQRIAMGERGKTLVNNQYTWPSVARRMKDVYSAAVEGDLEIEPNVSWFD